MCLAAKKNNYWLQRYIAWHGLIQSNFPIQAILALFILQLESETRQASSTLSGRIQIDRAFCAILVMTDMTHIRELH